MADTRKRQIEKQIKTLEKNHKREKGNAKQRRLQTRITEAKQKLERL
jgi:DNA-binding transcriptional regulator GbsR (MarR family)